MLKRLLFCVLALGITLAAAIYQRKTGPTYPKETNISIDNQNYELSLPRSHGGDEDCLIVLNIPDPNITGVYRYRKYPTQNKWTQCTMRREDKSLIVQLPHQPPAGKLEYELSLLSAEQTYKLSANPIIIRFKGAVPVAVLIPHVIFMFLAMFMSNLAGLLALFNQKGYKGTAIWTYLFLILGGMILGPIVQKFAFGEFWTGIPFGWDLTDNKTLIAFIIWSIALIANYKKKNPGYIWISAIVMLIIFSIPHSMFGSQLDHSSGKVIQGIILR